MPDGLGCRSMGLAIALAPPPAACSKSPGPGPLAPVDASSGIDACDAGIDHSMRLNSPADSR